MKSFLQLLLNCIPSRTLFFNIAKRLNFLCCLLFVGSVFELRKNRVKSLNGEKESETKGRARKQTKARCIVNGSLCLLLSTALFLLSKH